MKHVYSVLVLLMALVVSVPTPVWADGWSDRPDLPGTGSGGDIDDSDHPWGGDWIIGGGSEGGVKSYKATVLTGYPIFDLLINNLISDFFITEAGVVKTRQPAVLSKPSRLTTVKYGEKQFISFRKER
jgi:hypothetical protein